MHTQTQKGLSILLLTSLLLQSCGTNLMLGEQRSEMRKQKEEATQQAPLPSAEPTPPLQAPLHSQPKTGHASVSPPLQPHTSTENPPPYTSKAAWKARQQRRGRPLPLDCRGLLGGGDSDEEGAGEEKQHETSLDECVEIEGKHVSTQYWYEECEIGRILEAVLSSHSNDISEDRRRYGLEDGRNIFALGPLDNISPYGLSQALEDHRRQPGLVLIPFNLGCSHWVGLLLAYDPQGSLVRAEYYDSLQGRIPPYLNAMLQAHSYGRAGEITAFTYVSGQGLVMQANGSDCGPCTVENLLANAGLNYEPNGDSVRRRLRHLNVLEHNDYGGFYNQFYARQQRNQPLFVPHEAYSPFASSSSSRANSPQEFDALLALSVRIMHFPTLTARIQGIDFEQDDASLVLAQLRIGLEAEQENTAQDLRLIKENLFYWQESSPLESAPLKLDFNQLHHLKVLLSRGEEAVEAEREQLRGVLSASDIFSSGIFRAVGAAMVGGDFDPTIPPEVTCPLIGQKLAQPERELSLEQSIEVLTTCIKYGQVRAQNMAGQEGIIVIGNTGAGKSTFVNYLAGCDMILKSPRELGLKGIKKLVTVKSVPEGGVLDELMPIGHRNTSKTFMPQIETTADGHTYCDCPGFLDNRGAEINIANAVNIRAALAQAQGVKVVILINYHSLVADRARGLTDLVKMTSDLFGSTEQLVRHAPSILLGVSQAPLNMELAAVKEWLTEDTPEIMQVLADRLFLFDPLDRPIEGGWGRAECLRQIAALPPITSPGRIFRTVLTDSDEQKLVTISEGMRMRVAEALNERDFEQAAAELSHLEGLSVIDHRSVERLLGQAQAYVARHFQEKAATFRDHCIFDQFEAAAALLEELQSGQEALGERLAQSVRIGQLEKLMADAQSRRAERLAKEQQFESDLKAAQGRIEELQKLLEEQIAYNREQQAALQQQVDEQKAAFAQEKASMKASYEALQGQLQIELDEKLKQKEAALRLAQASNQQALQAQLEQEQAQLRQEYEARQKQAAAEREQFLEEQAARQKEREAAQAQREATLQEQQAALQQQLKAAEAEAERLAKAQRLEAALDAWRKEHAREIANNVRRTISRFPFF